MVLQKLSGCRRDRFRTCGNAACAPQRLPRNAYYIDGVFASPDGKAIVQPNMICLFERYAGDVSWRHSEILIPSADVCPLLS